MSNEITEIIKRGAQGTWGMELLSDQLDAFDAFAALLLRWNADRTNLTRIVAPREVAVLHFLDSLSLIKFGDIDRCANVVDIGTGAGFPGIVLKIMRPTLPVVLIDSTNKKLNFCRAVITELGLTNIEVLHVRAEAKHGTPNVLGNFDLVTARAVAALDKLVPWCLPYLSPAGKIVAMKGSAAGDEIRAAEPLSRKLGLVIRKSPAFQLPEATELTTRHLVTIKRAGIKSSV